MLRNFDGDGGYSLGKVGFRGDFDGEKCYFWAIGSFVMSREVWLRSLEYSGVRGWDDDGFYSFSRLKRYLI